MFTMPANVFWELFQYLRGVKNVPKLSQELQEIIDMNLTQLQGCFEGAQFNLAG